MNTLREMSDEQRELHRRGAADQFLWFQFKPEVLSQQNIPSAAYPIRTSNFDNLVGCGGTISIPDILRGLMDWLDATDDPASTWELLRQILHRHFPPSEDTNAVCRFWTGQQYFHRFRISPICKTAPSLSWQSGRWVVAIACSSEIEPKRMNIAVLEPITLQIARSIFQHARVFLDEPDDDNYTSALLNCSPLSSIRRWHAGEMTLIAWSKGYGEITSEYPKNSKTIFPALPREARWLSPNQVAAMIAIGNNFM